MRSPWLLGGLGLAWLAAASVLVSSPVRILILWVIGLGALSIYMIARLASLPRSAQAPSDGARARKERDPEVVGEQHAAVERMDGTGVQELSRPAPLAVGRERAPIRVMSADQVASLLRVEVIDVVQSMRSGELPGNRLSGRWLCNEESLRRWLDGSWH